MQPIPNCLETLVVRKYGSDDYMDESGGGLVNLDLHRMQKLCILIYDDNIVLTSPLPQNLCWFRGKLRQGGMDIFAISPPNKKLVILDLNSSHIQSLLKSFVNIENLAFLDLSYCNKLTMLPISFGMLKSLKNLQYSGIKNLS